MNGLLGLRLGHVRWSKERLQRQRVVDALIKFHWLRIGLHERFLDHGGIQPLLFELCLVLLVALRLEGLSVLLSLFSGGMPTSSSAVSPFCRSCGCLNHATWTSGWIGRRRVYQHHPARRQKRGSRRRPRRRSPLLLPEPSCSACDWMMLPWCSVRRQYEWRTVSREQLRLRRFMTIADTDLPCATWVCPHASKRMHWS